MRVALFAEHPDQWALLAERPELAQRAVEETMRYFGAVRGTARFASVDIEYRDVRVPRRHVHVGRASPRPTATPTCSPSPTAFDITVTEGATSRSSRSARASTTASAQALARAELQEALPLLARRMPNLRLDGPITWKPDGVGIFGPAHMPVALRPRPLTPATTDRSTTGSADRPTKRGQRSASKPRGVADQTGRPCGSSCR